MSVLLGGHDAASFTAAEVAAQASTHESTVVRLAQKLGYRGYPELRADLERDAGTNGTPSSLTRARSGHDLGAFTADESAALARLPEFVSQAALSAAALTLHEARTIYPVLER